ncbi:hypothetical protein EDC04DRAFT_1043350 [Pisolithus marmoratus]|nr:hypothetical protein EDC04DRAFT_1043350 [Pisolithus marmoratus]
MQRVCCLIHFSGVHLSVDVHAFVMCSGAAGQAGSQTPGIYTEEARRASLKCAGMRGRGNAEFKVPAWLDFKPDVNTVLFLTGNRAPCVTVVYKCICIMSNVS